MTSFSLDPGQSVNLSITMDDDGVHVNLRVEGARFEDIPEMPVGEFEGSSVGPEWVAAVNNAIAEAEAASAVVGYMPPKPPVNAEPAATLSGRTDKFGGRINPADYISAAEWLRENGKLKGFGPAMQKKILLSVGQHAGHIARADGVEPKWTGSQFGRGDRLYARDVWAAAYERYLVGARKANKAK